MEIRRRKCKKGVEITLTNSVGFSLTLSSLGAGIRDIVYKGKHMLASPKDDDTYTRGDGYFGKTVGPIGGRIPKGRLSFGGDSIKMPVNEGRNTLHSADFGYQYKLFRPSVRKYEGSVSVLFRLFVSPTVEYPAPMSVVIEYSLMENAPEFTLITHFESDRDVPVNIINHGYFNLGEASILDCRLTIGKSLVGVYDEEKLLRGVKKVDPLLDFRGGEKIGRHVDDPVLLSSPLKGYDHHYFSAPDSDDGQELLLESDDFGLRILTDAPSILIYSDNYPLEGNVFTSSLPETLHSCLSIEPSWLELKDGKPVLPEVKSKTTFATYSFFYKKECKGASDAAKAVASLVEYANFNGLLAAEDKRFYENMILHRLDLLEPYAPDSLPDLAIESATLALLPSIFLPPIKERLEEIGYDKGEAEREVCFLLGMLSPRPSVVENDFKRIYEEKGPEAATEYLYALSLASGYVEKDKVDSNIVYDARYEKGMDLEISINLSKPEKNNKDIAKLVGAKKSGYPACLLCYDNLGFGGTPTHPARGNIRFVRLNLAGGEWYLQFSPYGYFKRHCIVFSKDHVPMAINKAIFKALVDFVDLFPHYFIGSNADLPIVGGSILNHEHFQGGAAELPLLKAKPVKEVASPTKGARLYILDFYNTALLIQSNSKIAAIEAAEKIRKAWRTYDDPANDILSSTGEMIHNTVTPIVKKRGKTYSIYLILRNNRTDEAYPGGIFHAHKEYAHIKQEGIGLIEAAGLFVLPARLARQSKTMEEAVANGVEFAHLVELSPDLAGFKDMYDALSKGVKTRDYIANVCRDILGNVAVFKKDEKGQKGLEAFLQEVNQ